MPQSTVAAVAGLAPRCQTRHLRTRQSVSCKRLTQIILRNRISGAGVGSGSTCTSIACRARRHGRLLRDRARLLARSHLASEEPLSDIDSVACNNGSGQRNAGRHDATIDFAGDINVPMTSSRGEAACYGNGVLCRHSRHVGILTWPSNFAHDEDWTISINLDRHIGILKIATAFKAPCYCPFKRGQGFASRRHLPDQWECNMAGLIQSVRIRQIRLLENSEPHRVCRRPFDLSYAAMAGSSSMA